MIMERKNQNAKDAIVSNWLIESEFLTHVAMRLFTEFDTSRF